MATKQNSSQSWQATDVEDKSRQLESSGQEKKAFPARADISRTAVVYSGMSLFKKTNTVGTKVQTAIAMPSTGPAGGEHAALAATGAAVAPTIKSNPGSDVNMQLLSTSSLPNDTAAHLFKCAVSGMADELRQIFDGNSEAIETTNEYGQSLLHVAAKAGQTSIIALLIEEGANIDFQDNEGKTALYEAIEADQVKTVRLLVELGANVNLATVRERKAPVHLASELNRLECLQALRDSPEWNANLEGYHGYTALHFACSRDAADVCQLLLETECQPCKPDNFGQFPSHIAVTNSSAKCLSLIADFCQKKHGISRKQVINYRDLEGNVPLHAAVNCGDPNAVRLCLELEADIDTEQEDSSTPVHFACLKGELEMVQMMFEFQPKNVRDVLAHRDKNGHTPLHKAVMFNHSELAKFLLSKGSDPELRDNQDNTALLLAARKSAFDCLVTLFCSGADISAVDVDGRNVVHLCTINGTKKDQWNNPCIVKKLAPLLNLKDQYGCTPLHYATQKGDLMITEKLLHLGAHCRVANNDRSTPLHFAARYGRLNTCRHLVESCPPLLNTLDRLGQSPLHLAAENGHAKIVRILLQRGAVFQKDTNGNTCLHLAVRNGHMDCIRLLLSVNPILIDAQNREEKTALHLAAQSGQAEVVSHLLSCGASLIKDCNGYLFVNYATRAKEKEVLIAVIQHARWTEVLLSVSVGCCPVFECIQYLPECASMALDRSITDKGYKTVYDFSLLQFPVEKIPVYEETLGQKYPFLPILRHMVNLNRVSLLTHPLCEAYLSMKWNRYGRWIHNINILIYIIFLASLTIFVVSMPSTKHVDNGNFAEICSLQHVREIRPMDFYGMIFLPVMLLSAFSFINICKEILQMLQQRMRYFMDGTNYLELTLYGSTAGFVVPFYMGYSMEFQWNLGALATLLAWMNFLLFFQRYEQTGIYVIMFLRIAKTLFRVISLFSILIFGFGLSFYIVLQYKPGEAWQNVPYSPTNDEHEFYVKFYSIANGLQVDNYTAAWSNATAFVSSCFPATYSYSKSLDADPNLDAWNHPVLAILKTLMMMLGEFDYVATFTSKLLDGDPRTNHFYVTNFVLLVLFIILMPILLMNLLIGLAVGDIETVQNDATLQRIRLQVEWFAELESKFPRRFLAFVDRIQWEVFQKSCQRSCFTRCVNWLKRRLCKRGDPESDYAALDEEHAGESCDFEKISQDLLQQQRRQRKGQGDLMETLARQVEETQMKLKKMEAENTAQTQFLKMILAKMEIEVEEETDEGVDPKEMEMSIEHVCTKREKWRRSAAILSSLAAARAGVVCGSPAAADEKQQQSRAHLSSATLSSARSRRVSAALEKLRVQRE
ncbi:hypothetical protein BOX15_Mlig010017g1 [Macrostomum lignano]|uniref:Ion transport domain-containing protein n=1 Tax=Macrostomum lignano TaxID=282301 RepID=A0A267H4H8_9PLAT|nr:hypothetical protein BOX15_Mlig010017g1 [Macrostomum lignano]